MKPFSKTLGNTIKIAALSTAIVLTTFGCDIATNPTTSPTTTTTNETDNFYQTITLSTTLNNTASNTICPVDIKPNTTYYGNLSKKFAKTYYFDLDWSANTKYVFNGELDSSGNVVCNLIFKTEPDRENITIVAKNSATGTISGYSFSNPTKLVLDLPSTFDGENYIINAPFSTFPASDISSTTNGDTSIVVTSAPKYTLLRVGGVSKKVGLTYTY